MDYNYSGEQLVDYAPLVEQPVFAPTPTIEQPLIDYGAEQVAPSVINYETPLNILGHHTFQADLSGQQSNYNKVYGGHDSVINFTVAEAEADAPAKELNFLEKMGNAIKSIFVKIDNTQVAPSHNIKELETNGVVNFDSGNGNGGGASNKIDRVVANHGSVITFSLQNLADAEIGTLTAGDGSVVDVEGTGTHSIKEINGELGSVLNFMFVLH